MPKTLIILLLLLLSSTLHAQTPSLEDLSLKEKIAQMFIVSVYGAPLNQSALTLLQDLKPGGLVLLPSNISDADGTARLINQAQQAVQEVGGIPLFIAVDQEGGIIARLKEGFTTFPVPMLLTASGDDALAYAYGAALATELKLVGVNMDLAPVADLLTNRNNPIIGRRSFGSNPQWVGQTLSALISGMQSEGVLSIVKHFPGHGETHQDSHTALPVLDLDRERFETVEWIPFEAAIAADVSGMMLGHLVAPQLDPEALPASLSPTIVNIIRTDLSYDGLIMTDALDMDAIDTVYSPEEASVQAILAGNDLILLGAHVNPDSFYRAIDAVVLAVENGTISEAAIDQSVSRILAAKQHYDLLNWQALSTPVEMPLEEHIIFIKKLFDQGVTLAKDEQHLIPIHPGESVGLVFPATQPKIAEVCKTWLPDLNLVGVSGSPSDTEIAWAAQMAAQVDKIIVFTINADQDPNQQKLVRSLPPEKTIVVALWSAYDLESFPDISSYIVTYSPMQYAYESVCKGLSGDLIFNGRLALDLADQ
ncbi:glycoside hydrolase family 3 protein [Anaerolineales bacterium]